MWMKLRYLWFSLLLCVSILFAGCSSGEPKGPIDFPFLKQNIKPGMKKAEVKKILGSGYTEVIGEKYRDVWRYDFGVKEGYAFKAEDNLDFVDLEGLSNGSMKSQLFISFTAEGKVARFVFYTETDGKLQEFQLLEDGTEKIVN
jgi:hypothetical protein